MGRRIAGVQQLEIRELPSNRVKDSLGKSGIFGVETMEVKKMYRDIIQSDPSIMMGKPVIAGTRITVEFILEKLAAGETVEQILEAHPRLTRESVQAALAFAAEALRADVIYPLPEMVR